MQAVRIVRQSLRLFGVLALMAAPAAAVTVTGLYSVEVPSLARSLRNLSRAMRTA